RDNAWPNENGRNTGVLGRPALKSVNVFALAGDRALAADHSVTLPHEVISGPRVPSHVVGKMIIMRPVAPQSELPVSLPRKNSCNATKPAHRKSRRTTRSQGGGRARELHFTGAPTF